MTEKEKNWLFHLNAFLNKSDSNYIAGRALWRVWDYDSAGNLIWLGIEQLIKIIIVQNDLTERKFISSDEFARLDTMKTTNDYCNIISIIFKKINKNHSVDGLIRNCTPVLKIILEDNIKTLKNLNFLYQNRYYIPLNRTTYGNWLKEFDSLYFEIRAYVSEFIPRSRIDEILFYIEFNQPLVFPIDKELVINNSALKNRKYPRIHQALPTGGIVSFDGMTKE